MLVFVCIHIGELKEILKLPVASRCKVPAAFPLEGLDDGTREIRVIRNDYGDDHY